MAPPSHHHHHHHGGAGSLLGCSSAFTRRRAIAVVLLIAVFALGFLAGTFVAMQRPAGKPGPRPTGALLHHHHLPPPHAERIVDIGDNAASSSPLHHTKPPVIAGYVHEHDDRTPTTQKNAAPQLQRDTPHIIVDTAKKVVAGGDAASASAHRGRHGPAEAAAEAARKAALLANVPADSIEATAIHRSLGGRLFVIPVNDGYIDFGLNLLCSMEALGLFSEPDLGRLDHHSRHTGAGYLFVAMDQLAFDKLSAMGLPVIKDPDVPFVSSKSAAWGDPKFHALVCTKLIPVLRFLRAGLDVVLSDADIVFRHDPFPFLRQDLGLTFTIGSCHRDLPDDFDLASGDGLGKLNTGFYYAKSTAPIIQLLSRALANCQSSHLTGDQPAMNTVLHEDQQKGGPLKYRYGFFDGCLFANGCIFFKKLCANTTMQDPRPAIARGEPPLRSGGRKVPTVKLTGGETALPAGHIRRDDPVMVHANFLVGKKDKIKKLTQNGLWNAECIAAWRQAAAGNDGAVDKPALHDHGDAKAEVSAA